MNDIKPEMIPFIVVMILVAVGVVLLNDKLKKKSVRPDTPAPKGAVNVKGLLFGVPIVIATSYFARELLRENPDLKWIVPCVVIALLVGLFHRILWMLFKAYVLGGSKPLLVRTKEDGKNELDCPKCKTPGPFAADAPGGILFKCEKCGMELKNT